MADDAKAGEASAVATDPPGAEGSANTAEIAAKQSASVEKDGTPDMDTAKAAADAAVTGADDGKTPVEEDKLPDNVVPLFMTGASQELFSCRCDEDVTEESPYKMIPIEAVKKDFHDRAAVSDFHPVKEQLLSYDGEEVLVMYDYDFKYGQNFIICLTEQAKAALLESHKKQAEEEVAEVEAEREQELAAAKAKRERGWVSQGSEKEIDEAKVVPSRPKIRILVSRRRRFFGRPVTFHDQGADDPVKGEGDNPFQAEFTPAVRAPSTMPGAGGRAASAASTGRRQSARASSAATETRGRHLLLLDKAVEAVTETADAQVQTERRPPKHMAVQYEPRTAEDEGIDLDLLDDVEERKLNRALSNVLPRMLDALTENAFFDVMRDDLAELKSMTEIIVEGRAQSELKGLQSLKYGGFAQPHRLTAIDEHPYLAGVIVAGYSKDASFETRVKESDKLLRGRMLLWTLSDATSPKLVFEAPDQIHSVRFCPTEPHIIVAGCANGQIAVWDFSRQHRRLVDFEEQMKSDKRLQDNADVNSTNASSSFPESSEPLRPVAVSTVDAGHRGPITDLAFFNHRYIINPNGTIGEADQQGPKYARQFVTTAADGTCLVWDLRGTPPKPDDVEPAGSDDASDPQQLKLKQLYLAWQPFLKVFVTSDATNSFMCRKFSLPHPSSAAEKLTVTAARHISDMEQKATSDPQRFDADGKCEATVASLGVVKDMAPDLTAWRSSTMMLVGTEQGEIVYLNMTPPETETGKLGVQSIEKSVQGHGGPVAATVRSPFFRNVVLSVGGSSLTLWLEGAMHPILRYRINGTTITCAAWSLQRPGVFFVGRSDGVIDVWDMMESFRAPSLSQPIASPNGLRQLCPAMLADEPKGMRLTGGKRSKKQKPTSTLFIGDDVGAIHVATVPASLCQPGDREAYDVYKLICSETQRLLQMTKRMEEGVALQHDGSQQQGHENADASGVGNETAVAEASHPTSASAAGRSSPKSGTEGPQDVIIKEYRAREEEFLKSMGLVSDQEKAADEQE